MTALSSATTLSKDESANRGVIHVRELAGWGFDEYTYRPLRPDTKTAEASCFRAHNRKFEQTDVLLNEETAAVRRALAAHAERPDLLVEMKGLKWSLGVVDLRSLIAFQRRLFFNPEFFCPPVPTARDWPALIALAFAQPAAVACNVVHDPDSRTLTLRSTNPNLQLRVMDDAAAPVSVHSGSPFFEVARYRGRWFLRDGYHRAYNLLRAGVFEMPAVIIETKTIEELGAVQPWFFSEEILMSQTPPLVTDFLNEDLVLEYNRPALIKTLRITMEETLAPATDTGDQS
jgi:hypothetical protein